MDTVKDFIEVVERNEDCFSHMKAWPEYIALKALADEVRGKEWQPMADLPDGDYVFYNKNWKLRTTQTGDIYDGKLRCVGSYFAHDIEAPTHYANLSTLPQPKQDD